MTEMRTDRGYVRSAGLWALAVLWTTSPGAADTGLVEVDVPSGGIHEECFRTRQDQWIKYSFRSDRPLEFNIHYHQDQRVVYLRQDESARAAEPQVFHYPRGGQLCWMWTNSGSDRTRLAYRVGLK